jgi:multicomponent Na+:H+ antiporter subunit D
VSIVATAPVLVPLATAGLTALAMGRARTQQAISFGGALAFLGVALALVARGAGEGASGVAFGNWAPPYGIQFQLDGMSSVLVLVTALMGVAALLFLASEADPGPRHPSLLPLLHGTLAGVAGAFSTADLFNLYVWFEVMLICALGLLALGGRREQLDAAFKYLVLNLFGTLLLLAAVGLIYAATGHLNFDALAAAARRVDPALLRALLPAPVLALVAGLLTKVGVYALMRTLGDVFMPAGAALYGVLGGVAAATMLAGVLGAAYHWDMRRILAFHVISQVGYILMGVALGGAGGNAAALFYTVHHIVVKANLFLIAGMVATLAGSYDLRGLGGLAAARPALALLFAVPALSLVGVPPLSGFWAKLLVLQQALAQQRYAWAALALLVSVLTLYSMLKIWLEAFWKPHSAAGTDTGTGTGAAAWRPEGIALAPAWVATGLLAAITLAIGLAPQVLVQFTSDAAAALGRR